MVIEVARRSYLKRDRHRIQKHLLASSGMDKESKELPPDTSDSLNFSLESQKDLWLEFCFLPASQICTGTYRWIPMQPRPKPTATDSQWSPSGGQAQAKESLPLATTEFVC